MPHNFLIFCIFGVCLIQRSVTSSTVSSNKSENPIVVIELAIVCDKEFGDVFDHEYQRILEYWTIFLADLSLRFKTLPNVNVSFNVTSITVIKSYNDQPYIESIRGENGSVKLTSVLAEFAKWVYSKRKTLPKFDVAMAVTGASLQDNTVGVAYGKGACLFTQLDGGKCLSSVVIADKGTWSVGAAAHELGHLLGAPHDAEISGCNETGFVMSGMIPETQYFFSSCSNRLIEIFLKSDQSKCLKQFHATKENPALLHVIDAKPPSMEAQCQQLFQNKKAFVYQGSSSNCQHIKCGLFHKEGYTSLRSMSPVDGSPCDNDRGLCFRGKCIPLGFTIINMATGYCLRQNNSLSFNDNPVLTVCPHFHTAIDKFLVVNSEEDKEIYYLATVYSVRTSTGAETRFKCMKVNSDLSAISFVKCSQGTASSFKWITVDGDQGNLMLSSHCVGYDEKSPHKVTCMNCDRNDTNILWKRSLSRKTSETEEGENFVIRKKISCDDEVRGCNEYYWLYIAPVSLLVIVGLCAAFLFICLIQRRTRSNAFNKTLQNNAKEEHLFELESLQP